MLLVPLWCQARPISHSLGETWVSDLRRALPCRLRLQPCAGLVEERLQRSGAAAGRLQQGPRVNNKGRGQLSNERPFGAKGAGF